MRTIAEFVIEQCVIRIKKTPLLDRVRNLHIEAINDIGEINIVDEKAKIEALSILFVHEYAHYLQTIMSLYGIRILVEYLRFCVYVVCKVHGWEEGDPKPEQHLSFSLEQLVDDIDDAALAKFLVSEPDQVDRLSSIVTEVGCLFSWTIQCKLSDSDAAPDWSVENREITNVSYKKSFFGVVTSDRIFFPFTPGFLIENMARRIDRWFATNEYPDAAGFAESPVARGYYNGLYHLLKNDLSIRLPKDINADEATVLICQIALMSGRPDHAVNEMLIELRQERAEMFKTKEETIQNLAQSLISVLKGKFYKEIPLWNPSAYDDPIKYINENQILNSFEEQPIIASQFNKIKSLVSIVENNPAMFVQPDLGWDQVKSWLSQFGIPKIETAEAQEEPFTTSLFDVKPDDAFSDLMQSIQSLRRRIEAIV